MMRGGTSKNHNADPKRFDRIAGKIREESLRQQVLESSTAPIYKHRPLQDLPSVSADVSCDHAIE
jgi:hypothetical protein